MTNEMPIGESGNYYDGRRPAQEYEYEAAVPLHNHSYLLPGLRSVLLKLSIPQLSLVDLGCGNGTLTAKMAGLASVVVGIDSSLSGIQLARAENSEIRYVQHDLATPLPAELRASFDVALAAEVIEHLFLPRELFKRARESLRPGGHVVVSTPYHGWLKNVAIALCGKYDHHHRPGWDYGHIKFFSKRTLESLASECGFEVVAWKMVGRLPLLSKSMIMVAKMKPLGVVNQS